MKKLKLTARIYVGFTGPIGRYQFVDGISVEKIPHVERVRIAANIACVEIEDDGSEGMNPSPAYTILAGKLSRGDTGSLKRQTEEEKQKEDVGVVMGAEEHRLLLSGEALEDIAAEGGIAALREVAEPWGVKSKSIPALLHLILDAQKEYAEKQRIRLTDRGVSAEEIARLLTPLSELPKAVMTKAVKQAEAQATVVAHAAETGDLAAALNVLDGDASKEAQAIKIVEAERPE